MSILLVASLLIPNQRRCTPYVTMPSTVLSRRIAEESIWNSALEKGLSRLERISLLISETNLES